MAWYDGTYSCGHDGRVNVIGANKDRQWKIDRHFEGLCPECYEIDKQKRFEEANQKAVAEAAEMDLPELTGSEKQVPWANTIRQEAIKKYEFLLDTQKKLHATENEIKLAAVLWDRILVKQTSAKYWIENMRGITTCDVDEALSKENAIYEKEKATEVVPKQVKQEALAEMVMQPTESVTSLITEIHIEDNLLTAKLPEKSEIFRLLARGLRMSWENGHWERKIGIRSGSALNRATELGVKLLAAGFPVRVYSDELQTKIASSDYEPECRRWVMKEKSSNMFVIEWDRSEADFYKESKRLPGARWESGNGMKVPKEAFREILDFADRYQFKLSSGAQKLAEEAKLAYESAMIADVSVKEKENLAQPGSRPELKPEEFGIDESLRDEN